jgi:hypothetical protein
MNKLKEPVKTIIQRKKKGKDPKMKKRKVENHLSMFSNRYVRSNAFSTGSKTCNFFIGLLIQIPKTFQKPPRNPEYFV